MKRLLTTGLCVLLVACSGSSTLVYNIEIKESGAQYNNDLVPATLRFTQERLKEMGEDPLDIKLASTELGSQLEIELANSEAADVLDAILQEDFSMLIMTEALPGEAERTVEGHGNFKGTGISAEHVQWMAAGPGVVEGQGRVTIIFNEAGRDLMESVFEEHKDKFIGIFVGDQLVAKLLVDTDELRDDIVITGIPSPELAQSFADKVNVGLYVSFVAAN